MMSGGASFTQVDVSGARSRCSVEMYQGLPFRLSRGGAAETAAEFVRINFWAPESIYDSGPCFEREPEQ